MEEIKCDIVCEDAYEPKYATELDACMDLKVQIKDVEAVFIKPNEVMKLSTGVRIKLPKGYGLFILPRSSTGIKLNCSLANTVGVIDAGYRDEIILAIRNNGDTTVCLTDQQRVAQMLIIPRPYVTLNRVALDENFLEGDRGGGIGSTGN